MPKRARDAIANCSKEEGDEICRLVLKLVRAIQREVKEDAAHKAARPPVEPVHPSPTYRQYERYVAPEKAG